MDNHRELFGKFASNKPTPGYRQLAINPTLLTIAQIPQTYLEHYKFKGAVLHIDVMRPTKEPKYNFKI